VSILARIASTVGVIMAPTPGIPSTYEIIKVRLYGGKCLGQGLAGIWRQLVEQRRQLVKFRRGALYRRKFGLPRLRL